MRGFMSKIYILNRISRKSCVKIPPAGNSRAITLVETLFSVVIVSLVMVSVISVFVHTVDLSRRIDYEYTATNLAKNRIERARSYISTHGFNTLPDLVETDTVVDSNGVSDLNGDLKRTTAVTTSYGGGGGRTRGEGNGLDTDP